ncbi:ABC transporter permease, partial [Staphylococcus epidermidis]
MINSIKQENFKLLKKRSTFIIPLIIIVLMTLQALLLKNYVPPKV